MTTTQESPARAYALPLLIGVTTGCALGAAAVWLSPSVTVNRHWLDVALDGLTVDQANDRVGARSVGLWAAYALLPLPFLFAVVPLRGRARAASASIAGVAAVVATLLILLRRGNLVDTASARLDYSNDGLHHLVENGARAVTTTASSTLGVVLLVVVAIGAATVAGVCCADVAREERRGRRTTAH